MLQINLSIVSNGFNCTSQCTILQSLKPSEYFIQLTDSFFSFFLTIQFTKLQVILSLEEEIACTIRSTINKHDKPRNSLLSRDRKSGVKKSNMTHIPPYLMLPPSICGNRQKQSQQEM